MIRAMLSVSLLVMVAGVPISCAAQQGGGRVVRVEGASGAERCIDPYNDKVWLTLRGLTVSKAGTWFTTDKDVSLIMNARVNSDPAPPNPIVFPLMSVAKLGDGPPGQIIVPIEYQLVSGLTLKQDNVVYTGLGVELTLINIKDRSKLGNALQALETITAAAKLPIPASPYTQAATYLTAFANSAVQKDIDAQKDDKAIAGAMQFNFDPEGKCLQGDFEKTGTKAIIFAAGEKSSPGYVNIEAPEQYCFNAKLTPAFILGAAKRVGDKDCSTYSAGDFKTVTNNYVGLFLNKQTTRRVLGPNVPLERDNKESATRCKDHGIPDAQCI